MKKYIDLSSVREKWEQDGIPAERITFDFNGVKKRLPSYSLDKVDIPEEIEDAKEITVSVSSKDISDFNIIKNIKIFNIQDEDAKQERPIFSDNVENNANIIILNAAYLQQKFNLTDDELKTAFIYGDSLSPASKTYNDEYYYTAGLEYSKINLKELGKLQRKDDKYNTFFCLSKETRNNRDYINGEEVVYDKKLIYIDKDDIENSVYFDYSPEEHDIIVKEVEPFTILFLNPFTNETFEQQIQKTTIYSYQLENWFKNILTENGLFDKFYENSNYYTYNYHIKCFDNDEIVDDWCLTSGDFKNKTMVVYCEKFENTYMLRYYNPIEYRQVDTEKYSISNPYIPEPLNIPYTNFLGWYQDSEFKTPYNYGDMDSDSLLYPKLEFLDVTKKIILKVDGDIIDEKEFTAKAYNRVNIETLINVFFDSSKLYLFNYTKEKSYIFNNEENIELNLTSKTQTINVIFKDEASKTSTISIDKKLNSTIKLDNIINAKGNFDDIYYLDGTVPANIFDKNDEIFVDFYTFINLEDLTINLAKQDKILTTVKYSNSYEEDEIIQTNNYSMSYDFANCRIKADLDKDFYEKWTGYDTYNYIDSFDVAFKKDNGYYFKPTVKLYFNDKTITIEEIETEETHTTTPGSCYSDDISYVFNILKFEKTFKNIIPLNLYKDRILKAELLFEPCSQTTTTISYSFLFNNSTNDSFKIESYFKDGKEYRYNIETIDVEAKCGDNLIIPKNSYELQNIIKNQDYQLDNDIDDYLNYWEGKKTIIKPEDAHLYYTNNAVERPIYFLPVTPKIQNYSPTVTLAIEDPFGEAIIKEYGVTRENTYFTCSIGPLEIHCDDENYKYEKVDTKTYNLTNPTNSYISFSIEPEILKGSIYGNYIYKGSGYEDKETILADSRSKEYLYSPFGYLISRIDISDKFESLCYANVKMRKSPNDEPTYDESKWQKNIEKVYVHKGEEAQTFSNSLIFYEGSIEDFQNDGHKKSNWTCVVYDHKPTKDIVEDDECNYIIYDSYYIDDFDDFKSKVEAIDNVASVEHKHNFIVIKTKLMTAIKEQMSVIDKIKELNENYEPVESSFNIIKIETIRTSITDIEN